MPQNDVTPAVDHPTFGQLLKRHRSNAGFSQEGLAERARISAAAVATLERGTRKAPRRETLALLSEALGLSAREQHELELVAMRARGRTGQRESDADGGHETNFPPQLTPFIGRDVEIAEIVTLQTKHRLLTIVGSGGVGKTRTALAVATRLSCESDADLRFIDLTAVTDGDLIAHRVAAVVEPSRAEHGETLEALTGLLKTRKALLLFDNCEHLVADVAAVVRTILQECPAIEILATSRERLRIAGEAVYRLPSLPVPDEVTTVEEAQHYPAIELFAERASAVESGFLLSDDNIRLVADVCRRLDGIPLAIELAVARLPALGIQTLHDRLTDRLTLSGGDRDLPPRQQTMLATIAWSYNLLTESERMLLRRLAVFTGGFSLEAAEGVCGDDGIETASILELVSSLVDKSLVHVVGVVGGVIRYRLLHTLREYGLARVADAGETAALARRHAEWFATFADRADAIYLQISRDRWLSEMWPDFDNVRAALAWSLRAQSQRDVNLGGRIVAGLRALWTLSGQLSECRHWVEAALERIDEERFPAIVAGLLRALTQCSSGAAQEAAARRALTLYERLDEGRVLALLHVHFAYCHLEVSRVAQAEESLDRALTLLVREEMLGSLGYCSFLSARALLHCAKGEIDAARADVIESETLARSLGDEMFALRWCVLRRADIEFTAGNVEPAAEIVEAVLADENVSNADGMVAALAYCALARFRLVLGQLDAAHAAATEALRRASHRKIQLFLALQHLAALAAVRGETTVAGRLLGFLDAAYAREGYNLQVPDQRTYDMLCDSLGERLSQAELAALRSEGARLTLDVATAEASTI